MENTKFIDGPNGKIAYHFIERSSDLPPIVFLCGFKSDMGGSKAEWLHDYCVEHNRTFLRFDYFAHGQSDGDFREYTIGHGVMDSLFMMNEFITRPAIVIGSSMGGWISMRLIQMMPDLIHGFIGIAAAPDFTRKIYAQLDDGHLNQLKNKGYIEEDSGYEEPYIFTQALFEDGEHQSVMDRPIEFDGKVHLLQGKQDTSVDWHVPEAIDAVFENTCEITLIDDGDHSLSRPQNLKILQGAIDKMSS